MNTMLMKLFLITILWMGGGYVTVFGYLIIKEFKICKKVLDKLSAYPKYAEDFSARIDRYHEIFKEVHDRSYSWRIINGALEEMKSDKQSAFFGILTGLLMWPKGLILAMELEEVTEQDMLDRV